MLRSRRALRFGRDGLEASSGSSRTSARWTQESLRQALDGGKAPPGWSIAGVFGAYAAVRNDPEFVAELPRWVEDRDADVRWFVALTAMRLRNRALLALVAAREPRPGHRSALARTLARL